jgi:hypothetical protein
MEYLKRVNKPDPDFILADDIEFEEDDPDQMCQ